MELGWIGQLAPAIAAARDIPPADEIYVGELDLERLARAARGGHHLRSHRCPGYPSIVRDLSILVDDSLACGAVRGTIRAAAPATLVEVREFDRYQGTGCRQGRQPVACV